MPGGVTRAARVGPVLSLPGGGVARWAFSVLGILNWCSHQGRETKAVRRLAAGSPCFSPTFKPLSLEEGSQVETSDSDTELEEVEAEDFSEPQQTDVQDLHFTLTHLQKNFLEPMLDRLGARLALLPFVR